MGRRAESPFKFGCNSFVTPSPKSDLVIAIDFGTTYTGVAFAYAPQADTTGETVLNPDQLRDKITVLKSWPGVAGSYSEKVPTTLAYNAGGPLMAWGGTVGSSHPITISHFKLDLQQGLGEHYGAPPNKSLAGSNLERMFSTDGWKHANLPNKKPYNYVEDFLTEIRDYVVNVALPKDFGQAFLTSVSIRYVLTVPAIWSDKAKDMTQRAAVSAGIPSSRLTLVTEPEAAALYCSTLCHEVDLKDGDCFVVCDAGGGTTSSSHSAIMRGAVLSALGLRVQEHIMRRHYGVVLRRRWEPTDPIELYSISLEGKSRCNSTFKWYVYMGKPISYGYTYSHDVHRLYTEAEWEESTEMHVCTDLWVSDTFNAPEYHHRVSGVSRLASVTVDVKKLPPSAVTKDVNPQGQPYYKVSYSLMICFVTTLEFKVVCQGDVYGSVVAEYV